MDRATELDIVRRAYAKQMLAVTVRREDFMGPGPWVMPRWLNG